MPRLLRIEYARATCHLFLGSLRSEWLCSTDWTQAELSRRAKVELARLQCYDIPMSCHWISERLRIGRSSNVAELTAPC